MKSGVGRHVKHGYDNHRLTPQHNAGVFYNYHIILHLRSKLHAFQTVRNVLQ